jgi:hypothetical protein
VQSKCWVAVVSIIAACFLLGRALARPHRPIDIVDFAYQPSSAAEEMNSPITWTNRGAVTHTVTFDTEPIASGPIMPGQTFSISLPTAGHYTYHCSIHSSMTGAIDVQPQQFPPLSTPRVWLPIIIRNQQ